MIDKENEEWTTKTFEVKTNPKEGEYVQYIALHISQVRELNIPNDEIKFFIREKEG